ncbi:MAG: carbohydrate-binding protein [Spirochaetales bacterium]|nr:carbohydrate-binding protein [Spirochaetales bacterium]
MKKRLLVLVFLMIVSTVLFARIGDVNGDSEITIVDALLVAQYYVNMNPQNFNVDVGDMNGDNVVNIVDALLMAQVYIGLIEPPEEKTNTITIEAEEAYSNDAVVESEYPGYSGRGYINTANVSGAYVEWIVNSSAAGNVDLFITFANGGSSSRPMEILVNNAVVVSRVEFSSTADWQSWTSASASVALVSGQNILRFNSLTSGGAPNLDKLVLSGSQLITIPAATPSPVPVDLGIVGWGSVNYLNQNGTSGGAGGETVDVYDFNALKNAVSDSTPRTVIIHGNIATGTPQQVNVYANKTIIGDGNGAYLDFGFYMRGNNIILKNLDIWNGGAGDEEGYDGISWASNLHHFWIDHCTFHSCTDGAVDPTRNVRFVTISYCRFYDQIKTMLIGSTDDDPDARNAQNNSSKNEWHYTVTVHHNWFQQTSQRHPRVRFGAVHVYNNYYEGLGTYAIGRGDRANIYSEANYFYNAKQCFAAYDDSSNPGYVDDVNSLFEGSNSNTGDNPPSGSWVWRPSDYYQYTAHSASWIKSNLKNYAGAGKVNP